MTKMPTTFRYQKQVWSLFVMVGLLLAAYLSLVGLTVYNTWRTEHAEQGIGNLTAEVSQMEFAYLSSEAKITMDLATSMGFVEPANVVVAKVSSPETTAYVPKDKI